MLLVPYGSPPQNETFDPKPDTPAARQGSTRSRRGQAGTTGRGALDGPGRRDVPRGKVVGGTGPFGGDVRDAPVSPKDIPATAFHLLGIDPRTTITDPLGRLVPVAGSGEVRPELFG
jgi:hypothetical protein